MQRQTNKTNKTNSRNQKSPRSPQDRSKGGRSEEPKRYGNYGKPRRPGPTAPRPPREVREVREVREEDQEPREISWGRHVAQAALEGTQSVNKVWVLKSMMETPFGAKVRQLAKEKGAALSVVEKAKLDALTFNGNHQGIVVSIAAHQYADLDELIATSRAAKHPLLLVLDGVEDPHNLGALIRTAVGAGAQGVIIPTRRAVGLTGTVEKASAGTLDQMPVARAGNLTALLKQLKKAGFWIMAAAGKGEKSPYEIDLTGPLALVIGGEGEGVSRLVLENSDWVVRLPMAGKVESLNASVAGGILMYEVLRQRLQKDPAMLSQAAEAVEAEAVSLEFEEEIEGIEEIFEEE